MPIGHSRVRDGSIDGTLAVEADSYDGVWSMPDPSRQPAFRDAHTWAPVFSAGEGKRLHALTTARLTRGAMIVLTALLGACTSTRVDNRQVASLSGAEMYERLCSSCHGADARGDGPVAPLIKVGVPDLTLLAQRHGGEFPTEDVKRVVDGRWDRRAHGPRDMPVWGWQLYDMSSGDDTTERARVDSMIDRLVTHLQSVQRP
ncbi:MAG TPA: cytochrome c [Povalibacter sp.]|nr:cytochrome c [Povalibacter sp.]